MRSAGDYVRNVFSEDLMMSTVRMSEKLENARKVSENGLEKTRWTKAEEEEGRKKCFTK